MELAKIEVSRADARKVHCDTLTAGMAGAEVSFSFDASWDGLKRIAIFKASGVSKDMLLTEDRCQIPHEVLAKPCPRLVVGIVGAASDDSVVIPTVWAELGRVENGAKPSGDSSKKPTPEVWAQILGMIGDLKNLNTEDKSSLVAAINEVLLKGADPEEIQKIVEEYLEAHPGEAKTGMTAESDPTVFDWAKKELFNKANLIDPAGRNTFITIDGVEYYRYHCSAQNFEYVNPYPLPGSVTITIRTVSQYTDGVSGIVLHYADGTSDVIYPERGVVTTYTTDASKTFVEMSGRYDMENWNLIDMSVMSIQVNYNIGIPVANANAPGGVKAEPVTENDTQPVRIGEDGKLYTKPGGGNSGSENAKETAVLAEFTLTEDVDGTIRIPLSANPFAYSALLIEIRSQLMTAGRTQYTGQLYGGGKHSQIFHLNTVFDASSVKTVYVMTHLFHDAVHSIAAKKGDYMWNTTNHYTDVYPIETQADAKECVLEIENCSAVSGATFKVQGVK